uniref:Ribbon-helix-helix protein, copG family protein n=2 Tax=Candidatus Bipolaricaulota TaxID=67810 RepID=H5SKH1_9BACT|nr:ribbon-helix-helix protein, copG family protein [uncultured Acetothermia bacterium]BAL59326.1 ribbon-helix-helix protein, copG family protein [Candidatus Acetothermum autotrophicum]
MPAQTVKVAISLPKEEFRALEKRRRQLKQSRSAVIAKAIRHWLKAQQEAEDVQRYVEGYQKYPETEEEMAEAAALARMALADVEWEE